MEQLPISSVKAKQNRKNNDTISNKISSVVSNLRPIRPKLQPQQIITVVQTQQKTEEPCPTPGASSSKPCTSSTESEVINDPLTTIVDKKKPYICSGCSTTFSNYMGCFNHILKCPDASKITDRDADSKIIKLIFVQEPLEDPPKKIKIDPPKKIKIDPPKTFGCPRCDEMFAYKSDRNSHVLDHELVFRCDLCSSGFRSKPGLIAHKGQKHQQRPETLEVYCRPCNIASRSPQAFEEHQRSIYHLVKLIEWEKLQKALPLITYQCYQAAPVLEQPNENRRKQNLKELVTANTDKKFKTDTTTLINVPSVDPTNDNENILTWIRDVTNNPLASVPEIDPLAQDEIPTTVIKLENETVVKLENETVIKMENETVIKIENEDTEEMLLGL